MIEIKEKRDCVGCGGCAQRCPQKCIDMLEDEQGFLYPKVDVARCIECHLCEKVCPVINQANPRKPLATYAAKNPERQIQLASSSGGVFTAMAKAVIDKGGVIFGAKFDVKWNVVHDFITTTEGINDFQTSKYVQSRIGDTFRQAEQFLKDGRPILFSGTPCQLSGLRLFLRKEYKNLIAVDTVCHGVPSPLIWREYLKYVKHSAEQTKDEISTSAHDRKAHAGEEDGKLTITSVNFRDKKLGWDKFGLSIRGIYGDGNFGINRDDNLNTDIHSSEKEFEILFEPHFDNPYIQIFLKDLDLRPSCYACPAKCGKSLSDITLADFWGIRRFMPEVYDRNGVSLVMVNSTKGMEFLKKLPIDFIEASYDEALSRNPSIEKSMSCPEQSPEMWASFHRYGISGLLDFFKSLNMI